MSVFEYANPHLKRKGLGAGYNVLAAAVQAGDVQLDTLVSLEATKALHTLALQDDSIFVAARHIRTVLGRLQALIDWTSNTQ